MTLPNLETQYPQAPTRKKGEQFTGFNNAYSFLKNWYN